MFNPQRPVRIALVGLGWVALHRHLPALRRNPAFRVVGVVDRDAARARAVAKTLDLPYAADSATLGHLPWRDEIDAVSIAAPPMAHHDLVMAALALGKDVITEKPFAMNMREGDAMVAAAAAQQKILAVVHNFQFGRAIAKLERDLAAGKLGTLRRVHAVQLGNPRRRLPSWYPQLPLGLFYDESPHFFYLLQRLAGANLTLRAASASRGSDSTPEDIRLDYSANALPVSVACNFAAPVSEWHILIHGTEALGIVDLFRDFYIRLPQDGAHGLGQILRSSLWATTQHLGQYLPNGLAFLRGRLDYGNDTVFARFAEACVTRQTPTGINAADALAVLRAQHDVIGRLTWI